jgi:hypothetical protein
MPLSCLNTVFISLIVNRIAYCLSAWGGSITSDQVNRINAVLKRAKRYGVTGEIYIFEGLLECGDREMFTKMQAPDHCLHHLLPPVRQYMLVNFELVDTILSCLNVIMGYIEYHLYQDISSTVLGECVWQRLFVKNESLLYFIYLLNDLLKQSI